MRSRIFMQLFWIYALGLPALLTLYLALALPGRNPFRALGSTLQASLGPGGRRIAAVGALVLGGACLEARWDSEITRRLGYDLTALVARIEGPLVEWVQGTLPDAAVDAVSLFYLAGYVAYLLLPPAVWWNVRKELGSSGLARASSGYVTGIALNFLLALPFYFLFPVQEVAWSGLSDAEALMERTWSGITGAVRVGSALDNCFPSLHVSCTVTALWFARRHGPPAFARLAWVLTIGTAWTVMALGIHWGLDVASGVVHGALCAHLAARLGPALERRFRAKPSPTPDTGPR